MCGNKVDQDGKTHKTKMCMIKEKKIILNSDAR